MHKGCTKDAWTDSGVMVREAKTHSNGGLVGVDDGVVVHVAVVTQTNRVVVSLIGRMEGVNGLWWKVMHAWKRVMHAREVDACAEEGSAYV